MNSDTHFPFYFFPYVAVYDRIFHLYSTFTPHCQTHEAHNRVAAAGASKILVRGCACMSVHNRFMIEMYEFTHSLHTFVAHAAQGTIMMKDSEDKRQWQARERI